MEGHKLVTAHAGTAAAAAMAIVREAGQII
jgi:hypothetical protein